MTDQEKFLKVQELAFAMGYDEALKRLCPIGSVAETCFGGREADAEQVGADEERSDRQGRRVSPGEAEALVERWRMLASEIEKRVYDYERNDGWGPAPKDWKAEAVTYRRCANELVALFHVAPEPDSEAPKERSGRRTKKALTRARKEKIMSEIEDIQPVVERRLVRAFRAVRPDTPRTIGCTQVGMDIAGRLRIGLMIRPESPPPLVSFWTTPTWHLRVWKFAVTYRPNVTTHTPGANEKPLK